MNVPQSRAIRKVEPGNTICLKFGRGVGKSWFQRFLWYYLIAKYDGVERPGVPGLRGIRIVLLTPTFKHATDTHAKLLASELEKTWRFLGGKINRTKWLIEFPGGSWLQFFGAESADNARGIRCDVVSIDECDDIEQDVYDSIVIPWFSEPWSLAIKIATGTPKRGRHGLLYKLWRLGKDGVANHFSFHATYRDVPENVSASYVAAVKATTPPATFAREWEADEDAAEGLVYSMFDDFHVRQPRWDTQWTEVIVGVDWGWEDPQVYLSIGIMGSGREAVCWVVDEQYESHKTISWWSDQARRLEQRFPGAKWFADPSKPSDIETIKRDGGVRIVKSTAHTIEEGVTAVADRFVIRQRDPEDESSKFAKLYIHPRCTNLIKELGMYRRKRDPKNKERILDDIEDKNNHGPDALRYALFSRFGSPSRGMTSSGGGFQ